MIIWNLRRQRRFRDLQLLRQMKCVNLHRGVLIQKVYLLLNLMLRGKILRATKILKKLGNIRKNWFKNTINRRKIDQTLLKNPINQTIQNQNQVKVKNQMNQWNQFHQKIKDSHNNQIRKHQFQQRFNHKE